MENRVRDYKNNLSDLLRNIQESEIVQAVDAIRKAHEQRNQIFVIGNGGSAATANHFAADFGKNAVKGDENRPRVLSLCNNISTITALGNDLSYDDIFSEQLKNLMNEGDLLIAISASGNSPNIIRAVKYVKQKGGVIIGLTGFTGGNLKEFSDININIASNEYEPVEDLHMIITHMIVQCYKSLY